MIIRFFCKFSFLLIINSGADLANIVNEAAIMATEQKSPGVSRSLLQAAWTESVMGAKRPLLLSDQDKRLTAFHESGHALVAHFTKGASKIGQASIVPRGNSLGAVQLIPSSEHNTSKAQLLAALDTALGGRVSEEILLGAENVTTGAASDLKTAYQIAHMLTVDMGMSKLGFVAAGDKSKLSSDMQARIDNEINALLAVSIFLHQNY